MVPSKEDYTNLPDEVWLNILIYLDVHSILAVEQTNTRFESIVYDRVVTNDVRCSPNLSRKSLRAFFSDQRTPLIKRLSLDNCIMVGPDDILHAAGLCSNLTWLSCVGCEVNPSGLFSLLGSSRCLVEVAWSLYQEDRYSDRLAAIGELLANNPDYRVHSLIRMYVETVGDVNLDLLTSMVNRCSGLSHFHVHSVQSEHCASIKRWSDVWKDHLWRLESFTYCLEEPPSRHLMGPYAWFTYNNVAFRVAASLLGNVVLSTQPADTVNCLFLSDVMERFAAVSTLRQLVLAIKEPNSRSARDLDAAAHLDCWSQMRSLSLTLVPRNSVCQLPRAGFAFNGPLRSFLAACGSLTELNLTSFHFTADVDGGGIVGATLPKLRALAITPCGLNFEGSVECLAAGCARLEELDVRVCRDNASAFCKACELPLDIRESGLAALRSQLKRFSLCDVQRVASLDFLKACQLQELRIFTLSWVADDQSCQAIGDVLCASPNLRSFAYEHNRLDLSDKQFRRDLMRAKHLRVLTMYSELRTQDSVVRSLVRELTSNMPRLEVLHLHYTALTGTEVLLTWLARERGPGVNALTRGATVINKPCMFCSKSTFIGLARPRNRGGSCFLDGAR
ncbi:uncharacterized protein LOC144138033 [Haemaphysalis longicornis]|uniref:F-box domain-containing protein n=1 Tax=Haemaphysalis longicornis TaxID=44386 RepID=A0A9J6FRQ6_HAELO|nr:hypothetical protein HPB48_000701 [Haemaphysalis longicornis]